jgi:hypothetical protein
MFKRKKPASTGNVGAARFRRNQTLSGYTRSAGDDEPSARQKTHALNRLRRKVMAVLAALAVAAALVLFLLAQFISKIDLTADSGPVADRLKTNTGRYEQLMADYFNKNPLERLNFVLKADNMLLFLQQQAPEGENIEVRDLHGLPGGVTMHLTFRQPVAKWVIKKQVFYVDGNGKTFEDNYFEQPALNVVDENNISIGQGATIASRRLLESIGRSVQELAALGLKISKVVIPRGASREFDVTFDGVAYSAKMSIDRPSAAQAEDIKRVVDHLRLNGLNPSYIDVRIAGRTYYK